MSAARTKTIANDSLFCESRGSMGDLEDDLTNGDAMAATHDQIERMLAEKGRELLRQMMQAHYDARAAHERRVEVAGADGVERTQVRVASFAVQGGAWLRAPAAGGHPAPLRRRSKVCE